LLDNGGHAAIDETHLAVHIRRSGGGEEDRWPHQVIDDAPPAGGGAPESDPTPTAHCLTRAAFSLRAPVLGWTPSAGDGSRQAEVLTDATMAQADRAAIRYVRCVLTTSKATSHPHARPTQIGTNTSCRQSVTGAPFAARHCATRIFTPAVWGSGVRLPLAPLIFTDVCRHPEPVDDASAP
jgi:hypothetical protein